MKDYRRSIKEFEKVFKYKDSNKYDDSQYKLGLCYVNIGNKSRAKDEFQKLLDLSMNRHSQFTLRPDQKIFYDFMGKLNSNRFELYKQILEKIK